ncbi:hypothetical protein Tco_0930970 [Tanacetum coccineum]
MTIELRGRLRFLSDASAKSPYRLSPLDARIVFNKSEVARRSVKDKILATSSEKRPKVMKYAAKMLRDLATNKWKRWAMMYGVRGMILAAQSEAFKQENVRAERLYGYGMNEDGSKDEAQCINELATSVSDKTYYNLGDMYW